MIELSDIKLQTTNTRSQVYHQNLLKTQSNVDAHYAKRIQEVLYFF